MSVYTRFGMTGDSKQVIERHADRYERLEDLLSNAVQRVVIKVENVLKTTKLRGGSIHEKRDGNGPLASRSGDLLQAAMSEMDQKLSGYVGFRKHVQHYAKVLLGPDTYTMTPKGNNKNLWIPIADNLTPKGVQRYSPSEMFDEKGPKGGSLLRIFTSNAGNLIAALGSNAKVPGVRHKRDRIMFVLKKSVTVKGTDGLAEAARECVDYARDLFKAALREALS